MRIVKRINSAKKIIQYEKKSKKTIGFVPTMGYLHAGHLSLVRIARRRSKFVVVSIFVNPTQFGPKEDLAQYPRDLKRDLGLLKQEGVDLVFYPSKQEMYPSDFKTTVVVQELNTVLCGVSRPHHFPGVTTVVLKLFNIMEPSIAVFGKKDYQQAVIIKRMVEDLDLDVKIVTGPIIREKDGLAMSSRNIYLSKKQRENATILYQSLRWIKHAYKKDLRDPNKAIRRIKKMIKEKSGRIDYVEAVDKHTLRPVRKLNKHTVIALAVFFGKTRLIDNIGL